MVEKRKRLSWKPVRNGVIYCAPACGHGCLRSSYNLATDKAKALAKRLGPGWKPEVWENLGWHYSVKCGPISVREEKYTTDRKPRYSAMIAYSEEDAGSGAGLWTQHPLPRFHTPQEAVLDAIAAMRKVYMGIKEAYDQVEYLARALKQ